MNTANPAAEPKSGFMVQRDSCAPSKAWREARIKAAATIDTRKNNIRVTGTMTANTSDKDFRGN
ncbi:MAG TPA: hypothetical protein VGG97_27980 [Bryobacteraceae bacterium]